MLKKKQKVQKVGVQKVSVACRDDGMIGSGDGSDANCDQVHNYLSINQIIQQQINKLELLYRALFNFIN